MQRLLDVADTCPSGDWVVVAGSSRVDWRRAMYYLPRAAAVAVDDDRRAFVFLGSDGNFGVIERDIALSSGCGLLWLSSANPAVASAASPEYIDQVGWKWTPGSGTVSPHALVWRP